MVGLFGKCLVDALQDWLKGARTNGKLPPMWWLLAIRLLPFACYLLPVWLLAVDSILIITSTAIQHTGAACGILANYRNQLNRLNEKMLEHLWRGVVE